MYFNIKNLKLDISDILNEIKDSIIMGIFLLLKNLYLRISNYVFLGSIGFKFNKNYVNLYDVYILHKVKMIHQAKIYIIIY